MCNMSIDASSKVGRGHFEASVDVLDETKNLLDVRV